MVEVLGGLGDLGLCLDGLLERAHSGVRGDFEGEEVGIYMRGCGDGESDPPREWKEMSAFLHTQPHTQAEKRWEGRTNMVEYIGATQRLLAHGLGSVSSSTAAERLNLN